MNDTKKSIFESAIKVFSKCGYNGATMDAIASEAGVAKGTLYYHFKSKEEIFNFIVREGMELIKNSIEDVASEKDNILCKIKVLCRIQLSLVYESRDFFKVVMSQIWGEELRQLELRAAINKHICYTQSYLEEGMDKEVIKRGDSYLMAYTLFGTICSTAVYELINDDKGSLDQLIERQLKYILEGIQERK
ncbi:TetR/AcrR family transcriptional regulator [Clostridium sp. CX1]|uniref:TetR/AcrR family transcriptional regulator n=1 Tax=Clostridium sp. CX1 TaxID=2978346 RepID=UPI0021BEA9E5|nr:TetR/AcrR family transcriptional regulator [Clostridium sp. CX1]MCT8978729.1 TetR/AcrR family transcriptional regulator [Clostridium sp. CX1]